MVNDAANAADNAALDSVADDALDSATADGTTDSVAAEDDADDGDSSLGATDGSQEPVDANAWRRPYEDLGFGDLESPEQAQQRAIEALRNRNEENRRLSEQLRYMQSIESRLGAVQPQPPAALQQQAGDRLSQFAQKWTVPNAEVLSRYTVVEDGVRRLSDDAPPELVEQVNNYRRQQVEWSTTIGNPQEFDRLINERVERLVTDRLEGELSRRTQEQTEQQYLDQFYNENRWLFTVDPVTNQQTSQFSRDGQMFQRFYQEGANMGITSNRALHEFAHAKYLATKAQTQQHPAQQRQAAAPVVQDQRAKMLGRTNKTPKTQTVVAGANDGPGGNRTGQSRESFGRQIFEELVEQGMA